MNLGLSQADHARPHSLWRPNRPPRPSVSLLSKRHRVPHPRAIATAVFAALLLFVYLAVGAAAHVDGLASERANVSLRVTALEREALGHLPVGVAKVMLRSDTAGYQQELLRYCAEGRDERFGVIEFAVGVDVTAEFRRAVSEVAEEDWHVLHKPGSNRVETGQEWAEVNFVPNWIGHSKNSPEYRFMATRERLIEQPLPAMDGQMKMPFPAMELSNRGWFKVFGVVTNRTLAGDEVIWWSRQRCGKGEEVHSVLKSDLAGGRLPSRLFGANAAWWAIAVLAFNLSSAMKRLVLGGQWVSRRLKAVRFALIALPGRVMRHARRLIIRLSRDHPSYELLLRARQNILALAAEPYRA